MTADLPFGAPARSDDVLLEIRGLRTYFIAGDDVARAVDDVDLTIRRGQTLGLVGESGCGKSMTALTIMRLVPPPGRIVSGQIVLDGSDLTSLDERQMSRVRGARISMIFQEPMTSLNPVFTVGGQIQEAILVHDSVRPDEARRRTIEMMGLVGISQPETRYDAYPHELSGGMRQRVMIAMALACNPQLVIADEPTTALDVTIQAQILELMKDLRERTQMAVLLITHDLGVVAEMAEEVAVMYAGQIVEQADVFRLFKDPKHPYTQGLLSSIPTLATRSEDRLNVISGTVPNLLRLPSGCRFASRCPRVMDICEQTDPILGALADGRKVRCHLYEVSRPGIVAASAT